MPSTSVTFTGAGVAGDLSKQDFAPVFAQLASSALARYRETLQEDRRVLFERYQYDRKPADRFISHSMAKSIVSLAVGLALAMLQVIAVRRYAVGKQLAEGKSPLALASLLKEATGGAKNTVVVISADALATHQSVVTVMEASRMAGLTQVTFATQQSK